MKPSEEPDPLMIQIASLADALNILSVKTSFHVVSIRNTSNLTSYDFDDHDDHYRSIIKLYFDDIDNPILIDRFSCIHPPKIEHVEQALKWAEGKSNFLVHCQVGISRSSAMAYIIACSRMDPEDAIKYLNFSRHRPNRLVLQHGQDLLGKPSIIPVFEQHIYDYYKQFR